MQSVLLFLTIVYTYKDDSQWLKKRDVKRLADSSESTAAKLVPGLMCYNDNQLIAFYIRKNYAKLNDKEKELIEKHLMVDKVMEYLY